MKQVINATPGCIKENHEACDKCRLTFFSKVLSTNQNEYETESQYTSAFVGQTITNGYVVKMKNLIQLYHKQTYNFRIV